MIKYIRQHGAVSIGAIATIATTLVLAWNGFLTSFVTKTADATTKNAVDIASQQASLMGLKDLETSQFEETKTRLGRIEAKLDKLR